MSIPLLDMMTEEVSRDREAIVARAKQEAEAIRQRAQERSAAERTETLSEVDAELKAQKERARERAEAAAHMVVMTTKDSITDEVMAQVRAELARVADSPEFSTILESLLAELIEEAPEDGVVLAPPQHVEACRAWLQSHGKGGMRVEAHRSLTDGVAVQDAAHTFRVTNTLTTRFFRKEPGLRKLTQQRLFGKES